MSIYYIKGDVTNPIPDLRLSRPSTVKNILHICNDKGAWGAGFTRALSKKWTEPERFYRASTSHNLGTVSPVQVESGVRVFNMVAQHGLVSAENKSPLNYEALAQCLMKAADLINFCIEPQSVHMPRIGCGLAGGRWSLVLPLIDAAFTGVNVQIYVYDLPEK